METNTEPELSPRDKVNAKRKNIAKNTLKTLLTIVSPPLGLMSFGGHAGTRSAGLGIGVFLSTCSLFPTHGLRDKVLYTDSSIEVETGWRPGNLWRLVPEVFASPLAYNLDGSSVTYLDTQPKDSNTPLTAEGNDVISFDKAQGKYVLNFGEDRRFVPKSNVWNMESLTETKQKHASELAKLADKRDQIAQRQEKLESEGKLLEAREAYIELKEADKVYESTSRKFSEDYEALGNEYNRIKSVYQNAVDRMNADLEGLANSRQELTGEKEK